MIELSEDAKKIVHQLLKLLARRGYFSSELRSKMKAKGLDELATEQAIDYCKSKGYISDTEHLNLWLESARRRGLSTKAIHFKLKAKGVKLKSEHQEELSCQEAETLLKWLKSHERKIKGMEPNKRIAYFWRKGFSLQVIKSVLNEHF